MAVDLDFLSDEMLKAYRALAAGDFVKTFYDPVSETVKQIVIKPGGWLTEDFWAKLVRANWPVQGPQIPSAEQRQVGYCQELNSPFIASPVLNNAAPSEPMIDWEKVAGSYAAALAEANSKVAELERACDVYRDMVADFEAKSAPPAPLSRGQQIANALRFDPLPGAYAR